METKGPEEVAAAVKKVVTHFKLQDVRIHVSVAGREVLSRFTLIPVLKDKDTNKLIENEIRSQFPFIEQGDVECTHGYCEPVNPDKDSNDLMSQGRWLILAATGRQLSRTSRNSFKKLVAKRLC